MEQLKRMTDWKMVVKRQINLICQTNLYNASEVPNYNYERHIFVSIRW